MQTTSVKPTGRRPHVIVLGNEKGGSGKSTAAIHVAIGLLRLGYRVGTIDLDGRQATLTRHLSNRMNRSETSKEPLPVPQHRVIERSACENAREAEAEERWRFSAAVGELSATADFIVIDTPGSDNFLNRLGHSFADTLITPINDSFIDMDLLARVDPDTHEILKPSIYSEMVWEQRKQKAVREKGSIDWIVMRNRLGHTDARNKREIGELLDKLAKRVGFRIAPGFGERVIFRELFLKGLTLLDIKEDGEVQMTMSHVTARQEVRALLSIIAPEKIVPLPVRKAG